MPDWLEPQEYLIPPDLAQVTAHPLVARRLVALGLTDPGAAAAFLDHRLYTPAPPSALPDLDRAVERLAHAIQVKERILVWGDFDVDGQTSTTLLVSALNSLGAVVDFHIPVRLSESHGITLPVLSRYIPGAADLLLTCDTGITAHEAVDYAHQQGVDVIITDHHELPETLPPALAVINPRRLQPEHPHASLPGVGAAYKLVEGLSARLERPDLPETLLDLVALGIVADLATLRGDARYLLQRGLEILRLNCRLGLQVLFELAGVNPETLSEEQIGFLIAPRLNAIGRLADANPVVELLTTSDLSRLRILASQIEGLNAQRKLLTEQVFQGALSQIERDPALLEPAALVLAHPAWPAGVIGIVASRLVERFHKPTILLSAPEGGPARGSARSVEGIHITAAIASQRQMLHGFGGHPMSAGLAIDATRIPEFRLELSRHIRSQPGYSPARLALQIDHYLPLDQLDLAWIEGLERLAPFGPGNPPPVLASQNLSLLHHAWLGRSDEHLRLTVADEQGSSQTVLWWNADPTRLPGGRFDLAYAARISDYRGQRQLTLTYLDFRQVEAPPVTFAERRKDLPVEDFRRQPAPLAVLQKEAAGGLAVWAEGDALEKLTALGLPAFERTHLPQAAVLAVWTPPPGPAELRQALEQVSPQRLLLFSIDPQLDQAQPFLQRLAGLVKYALNNRQGQVSLAQLAALTAQRQSAVKLGLVWLAARGHITIETMQGDLYSLSSGGIANLETVTELLPQLAALLAESAAYRRHYLSVSPNTLV